MEIASKARLNVKTESNRVRQLKRLLQERIVILDGAMGTMIQQHNLEEKDFRGERFRDWRKDLKGGIVSSVALADGAAIATATDGKVRAYDLSDGGPRWIYDARSNFFAPPAVLDTSSVNPL